MAKNATLIDMDEDFFEQLAREAQDASLTFMLVGGHAVNAYGYQRTKLDVYLLIAESALGAWRTFYPYASCR